MVSGDVYVSTDTGIDESGCGSTTTPCNTIQYGLSIAQQNEIVYLYPGIYQGVGNSNLCRNGGCATNFVLSGFGDASNIIMRSSLNDAKGIYINNSVATISNITIENFYFNKPNNARIVGGGAISVYKSLVKIQNSNFINNSASTGGAIYSALSNLTISRSQFKHNKAYTYGGAIASLSGTLILTNYCEFNGNNVSTSATFNTILSGFGGAILFTGIQDNNTMIVRYTKFINNIATRTGGAIYMESSSLAKGSFEGSDLSFISNKVTSGGSGCISSSTCETRGGALYISSYSVLIRNSNFTDNVALTTSQSVRAQGGALFLTNLYSQYITQQSYLQTIVSNCMFENNLAVGQGGAVYSLNQRITIAGSTFIKNSAVNYNLFSDNPSEGGAVWFSAPAASITLTSQITDSIFTSNTVSGGWGGAFFGTDTPSSFMIILNSTFSSNAAISSYTNPASGGAFMIATVFDLSILNCIFLNNTAMPYFDLSPLTYSGAGGAGFVQSASLNISDSIFKNNLALTGQFDAGSTGGALLLEDAYPVTIVNTAFSYNGAAGFYGKASYSSSGSGGAIYVKFSDVSIDKCKFYKNWVSVGYSQLSLGGAIAVYFDLQSVSDTSYVAHGVKIENSQFYNNSAYSQICGNTGISGGEGGALAIVGANSPPVVLTNITFAFNTAVVKASSPSSTSVSAESLGGACSITVSSNVTLTDCVFQSNVAINGYGNDIASISGENNEQNVLRIFQSKFTAASPVTQLIIEKNTQVFSNYLCAEVGTIVNHASTSRRLLTSTNKDGLQMDTGLDMPSYEKWTNYVGSHPEIEDEDELRMQYLIRNMNLTNEWLTNRSVDSALDASEINSILPADPDNIPRSHRQRVYKEIARRINDRQLYKATYKQRKLSVRKNVAVDTYKNNCELNLQRTVIRYKQTLEREINFLTRHLQRNVDHLYHAKAHLLNSNFDGKNHSKELTSRSLLTSTNVGVILSEFRNSTLFSGGIVGSIVIASGSAEFVNPTFIGKYHAIFGDYFDFTTSGSDSSSEFTSSQEFASYTTILGNFVDTALIFTSIRAELLLSSNREGVIYISQLNLFNSTVYLDNNITITSDSFVSNSHIIGKRTAANYSNSLAITRNALINMYGDLFAGYSIQDILLAQSNTFKAALFNPSTSNSSILTALILDAVTLVIHASFTSAYPNLSPQLANSNNFLVQIYLKNGAFVNITRGGELKITANTEFQVAGLTLSKLTNSTSIPAAMYNSGKISLLGNIGSIVNQFEGDSINSVTESTSLTSRLKVTGYFIQTSTGVLSITLNETQQSTPVVSLLTNLTVSGTIVLNFYQVDGTVYANVNVYSNPSTWSIISYQYGLSSAFLTQLLPSYNFKPATIVGPTGLTFKSAFTTSGTTTSLEYEGVSYNIQGLMQSLVINSIGCSQVNAYYSGVSEEGSTSYPCYICLQNSSCTLCANGQCADNGQCGSVGSSAKYEDSCCSGDCESPYGNCEGQGPLFQTFTCECVGIFYEGPDCHDLTASAYGIIFSGALVVVIAALGVFFYFRTIHQKKVVLQELCDDLLASNNQGPNFEYIQYMQQALILNDVFVKNEEIKLEEMVGEGSFGVVHKATFRGAQVAVKKMRSMFLELTDKDIEEFRKEAYVMSRLRHPNIVLVMGISLVDQVPLPLPNKLKSLSDEDEDMISNNKSSEKKNKRLQKTVCIITEFLEQGSLADILYGPTKLPTEVWSYELILTCALQAARGMLYLHSHSPPICHRDLKSSNLVVDDHWVVKVTDFGMSRIVPEKLQNIEKGLGREDDRESAMRRTSVMLAQKQEKKSDHNYDDPDEWYSSSNVTPTLLSSKNYDESSFAGHNLRASLGLGNQAGNQPHLEMTSNLGTTAWCAPEVLTSSTHAHYTVKVDVYSFGVVLWELWERKRPFEELTSRFDIMDAVRAGKRPIISDNCPLTYKSFIQRCWHPDPARRPMFRNIVKNLKDELARVKRQKGLNINYGSVSNTTNQNLMQAQLTAAAADRSSSSSSQVNGASEFHSSGFDGDLDPNRSTSVDSGGGIYSLAMERAGSFFRKSFGVPQTSNLTTNPMQNLADNPSANQPIRNSVGVNSSNVPLPYPEQRIPLVAAFDRSLSYLTESPKLIEDMYGIRLSSVDRTASNDRNNSGGSDGKLKAVDLYGSKKVNEPNGETPKPYVQQHPAVPNYFNKQNQWRDRYVMKSTGWNSSKPDAGLPPSLASPHSAANSFGNSILHSISRSTITVTSSQAIPITRNRTSSNMNQESNQTFSKDSVQSVDLNLGQKEDIDSRNVSNESEIIDQNSEGSGVIKMRSMNATNNQTSVVSSPASLELENRIFEMDLGTSNKEDK